MLTAVPPKNATVPSMMGAAEMQRPAFPSPRARPARSVERRGPRPRAPIARLPKFVEGTGSGGQEAAPRPGPHRGGLRPRP